MTRIDDARSAVPGDARSAVSDDARGAVPTTVLAMKGVGRRFPDGQTTRSVLDGIDLEVTTGRLVVVMGPSGSGKSTLLRLAGGLDTADSGTIEVEGHDLARCSAAELAAVRRRSAGYVFQELNLVRSLSLLENVALPLELDGIGLREACRHAVRALGDLGLDENIARRRPEQVSGGERQRAAIARALVGDRRLILADEPTGALDSRTGDDIMRRLRDRVDAGAGAVVVTHDPRHAGWADAVVYLRDGRVVDRSTGGSAS